MSEKRDRIPELARGRLQSASVVLQKTSRYMEIIGDIMRGLNPSGHADVMSATRETPEIIARISAFELGENILSSVFDLYKLVTALDEHLQLLTGVFENQTYAKMALHNMSSTYTTNIYAERNAAEVAHEKYKHASIRDDEEIFALVVSEAQCDIIEFVIRNDTINKFTIKLIDWAIANSTGEKRRRAELIIEKQKDTVLGVERIKLAGAGVQSLISRYNLTAITRSMPLGELFTRLKLGYSANDSLEDNCARLARAGPGFILVNKSTPSPIEFNLSGLIDLDYVVKNNMKTPAMSGLTKKIIERFNTANMLARGGPAEPTRVIPGTVPMWYVLETINGVLWRQLGCAGQTIIPTNLVTGIVSGLTTRPHQYNDIQSDVIISRCFDPVAGMILDDYEKLKTEVGTSEPMRAAIVDKLTADFETKIAGSMPGSPQELLAMVVDQTAISGVHLGILTHTTGARGQGSGEYFITYITKFDGIVRAFIKELNRRWESAAITARDFKELAREPLRALLVKTYRDVTRAAAAELDSSRTWTDYDITLKEYFLERKQAII